MNHCLPQVGKTLLRWRRVPRRDHAQPRWPPWKKTTPADEISGFCAVTPDAAQQGANPRQSAEMRLAAARRQPCASQPAQKFTVGSGSDVSCYVITGSAVVIRRVGISFKFQAEKERETRSSATQPEPAAEANLALLLFHSNEEEEMKFTGEQKKKKRLQANSNLPRASHLFPDQCLATKTRFSSFNSYKSFQLLFVFIKLGS